MNTFISKLTASLLAMSLTLSCSSVLAADKKKVAAKPKPSPQQPKKASFMFVIDAKQGKIKKDKKGQFHLVLKHADMNHVILFSDRPQRIVKYITGKDLQTLWKEGKNSFEKDPPNAVLSGSGIKTQIVILNGIHITRELVRFPISVSSPAVTHTPLGAQRNIEHITLTIDNDAAGVVCCIFAEFCWSC